MPKSNANEVAGSAAPAAAAAMKPIRTAKPVTGKRKGCLDMVVKYDSKAFIVSRIGRGRRRRPSPCNRHRSGADGRRGRIPAADAWGCLYPAWRLQNR